MDANKEKKTEDDKNRNNFDNKQLPAESDNRHEGFIQAPLEYIEGWQEEGLGVQEYHNANHALWYLSMTAYSIIQGHSSWVSEGKIKRIIAHLRHLIEFIPEKEWPARVLVLHLLFELSHANPQNSSDWLLFFRDHWFLIRKVAYRYESHDPAFSLDKYQKIEDLVRGRYFFKGWWWEVSIQKIVRKMAKIWKKWMGGKS